MLSRVFPVIMCAVMTVPAFAGWEYPGEYVGAGWYEDDGSRFVISFRGGASYGMASIKNNVGALSNEYYFDPDSGVVISAAGYDYCKSEGGCENYEYAGLGELGDLPAKEGYSAISFTAGASIGLTLPNKPQWRFEAGWDLINETEYNVSPLFEGEMQLYGGAEGAPESISVRSGAAESKVSTNIISIMAIYDFFDGMEKPLRTFIPYIGIGLGYADSKTTLNLADFFGDLSGSVDLQNFGDMDEYGILQFYRSEHSQSNVAGLLTLGASYGLAQSMFLDFGLRAAYVPKIKWVLTNADNTRQRDWFTAENMFYINATIGIRFEF